MKHKKLYEILIKLRPEAKTQRFKKKAYNDILKYFIEILPKEKEYREFISSDNLEIGGWNNCVYTMKQSLKEREAVNEKDTSRRCHTRSSR